MNLFAMYDRFNTEFFNNSLPKVDIRFEEFEEFGWTIVDSDGTYTILIADRELRKKDIMYTLLHEMIHIHQAVNGQPINHGASFRRLRNKIAKQMNVRKKRI